MVFKPLPERRELVPRVGAGQVHAHPNRYDTEIEDPGGDLRVTRDLVHHEHRTAQEHRDGRVGDLLRDTQSRIRVR